VHRNSRHRFTLNIDDSRVIPLALINKPTRRPGQDQAAWAFSDSEASEEVDQL
jgi:hypothetical protein